METASRPRYKPERLLLAIAYLGFVSLGLPDALIGVAWPSIRSTFELPQSAMGLVFVASGCGYFASSFFTGRLLKVISIGVMLAGSSFLVAFSGFGYALAPLWLFVLGSAIFHGLGSGAVDAGLNSFVAHHFSARQMNWLHACYMLGAMLGPMLMTIVLTLSDSWRIGYATVGSVMLALSMLFFATGGRWGRSDAEAGTTVAVGESMAATLRLPDVWLQMALFFVYTGLEVTVGQWSYSLLTEGRGLSTELAGMFVTAYWAALFVGRLLFGWVVEWLPIDTLIRICALVAIVGCLLLTVPAPGFIALIAMMLIGFALAPVYPCLMTRTPQRLGNGFAAHAIGFQVSAAMIGAAALPMIVGLVVSGGRLELLGQCTVVFATIMTLLHEALLLRGPIGAKTELVSD
jgi:fucose permease